MASPAHLLAGRPIHFPFLSGIFEYDCASCSAPCCRGATLGIGRSRELVALLSISPSLALFAAPDFTGSPLPSIQGPVDACWFLDSRHRCRLEWAVGRDTKPGTCRLFPFHQLRLAGEHLVVMPHFLCPITVSDGPRASGMTSYDEICLEMHRAGVPRDGHPRLARPPDMSWDEALPLERQVRKLSLRHLEATSYLDFAQEQDFVTHGVLGQTLAAGGCDRLHDRIASLLGLTRELSPRTVLDLVALTPYLRMRGGEVARRSLPSVLVALAAVLAALESIPGTRMSARTVVQVFEHRLPLLFVLGHLNETPGLQSGFSADQLLRGMPSFTHAFARMLKEIELNGSRRQPRSLGQIIESDPDLQRPLRPEMVSALWRLGRYLADAGTFDLG
ncbi:MAG: hypothetical protein ABIJ09_03345 [Pseudomonadota bacterium]